MCSLSHTYSRTHAHAPAAQLIMTHTSWGTADTSPVMTRTLSHTGASPPRGPHPHTHGCAHRRLCLRPGTASSPTCPRLQPHLPSGPDSCCPHSRAAASRGDGPRRSLAGCPWLSRAWEQAFLGQEETPLGSTGTCPVWRKTRL